MTTIPKSVKLQLDGDWTGAGGVEPTLYLQEEDFRTPPPLGEDSVWIMSKSLSTDDSDVVNDMFVNEQHVLTLIVNTSTDADRLKELSDEVVRILNATPITDITYQRMRGRTREVTQNQGIWVFQENIVYDLKQQMKSSAAAYGAGSGPSLTQDNIEDLLMWKSANAAWVPCAFIGGLDPPTFYSFDGIGTIFNRGANDMDLSFLVSFPTIKGDLKLHISGTEIGLDDADANDFITNTKVHGVTFDTHAVLDTDPTNKNTIAAWQDTFTAIDCSSYDQINISLESVNTDVGALEVGYVKARIYYDTV